MYTFLSCQHPLKKWGGSEEKSSQRGGGDVTQQRFAKVRINERNKANVSLGDESHLKEGKIEFYSS